MDNPNYDLVPVAFMAGGMKRYIKYGVRPGHFLAAILCNDLMEAMRTADDVNQRCLFEWASWLESHAPPACYGSEERFTAWIAQDRHKPENFK